MRPRPTSLPLAFLLAAAAACGDDGGAAIDAAPGDDAAAPDAAVDAQAIDAPAIDAPANLLTLTSTALTEGGTIPPMYSCRGVNVSPPLAWSGGAAAPGYAVVLTDMSNNLVHSIIWDIPGATTALPENVAKVAEPPVPAGSKQPLAYDNQTRGYLGPCPPNQHTYRFTLYAVDALPLPTVTLASTRAQVVTALQAHDTATATLTATFTP